MTCPWRQRPSRTYGDGETVKLNQAIGKRGVGSRQAGQRPGELNAQGEHRMRQVSWLSKPGIP